MSNVRYLSDTDLLSELMGKQAVKQMYKGSITELLCCTAPNAHLYKLHIAREVMERACIEEMRKGVTLSSPLVVKSYLRTLFMERRCEVFVCLFMDVKNRLIEAEEMFRGTLTHTSVYPREVVWRALELNAAGVCQQRFKIDTVFR